MRAARTVPSGSRVMRGRGALSSQDHVLRDQSCGATCTGCVGPRLWTVMSISTSSGPSLAYSTSTSKYPPAITPVSDSSYSRSSMLRLRLVSTSSW